MRVAAAAAESRAEMAETDDAEVDELLLLPAFALFPSAREFPTGEVIFRSSSFWWAGNNRESGVWTGSQILKTGRVNRDRDDLTGPPRRRYCYKRRRDCPQIN